MSDRDETDEIFRERDGVAGGFVFDEQVAAVFPDMVSRSVPGYAAIIGMIELLAQRYARPGTALIDLGCSLGAATAALARGAVGRGCRVVGVDNAPAMLAQAAVRMDPSFSGIDWVCRDIRRVPLERASLVVLNFTLQFLPVRDRLPLLQRIRRALVPEGVLILSEKIAGDDAQTDRMLIEMHHAFKRANGYSELEISRKRAALENVLVPETLTSHRERLAAAGFSRADPWFQCFNFVSLVAAR